MWCDDSYAFIYDDDDRDLAGDAAGVGERQGFDGEKDGATIGAGSCSSLGLWSWRLSSKLWLYWLWWKWWWPSQFHYYQERFREVHCQSDWDVRTPPLKLCNDTVSQFWLSFGAFITFMVLLGGGWGCLRILLSISLWFQLLPRFVAFEACLHQQQKVT